MLQARKQALGHDGAEARTFQACGPIAGLLDVITVAKAARVAPSSVDLDGTNLEGIGRKNLEELVSFSSISSRALLPRLEFCKLQSAVNCCTEIFLRQHRFWIQI
jgi:hypothetical protein